jgi:hypothetical protein
VLCPGTTNPCGVFPSGLQNIKVNAGPDGNLGTTDDTFDAGADGFIGTGDDGGSVVTGYRREISIKDICDPDRRSNSTACDDVTLPAGAGRGTYETKMRQINVNVTYRMNSLEFAESVLTIISNY